MQENKPPVLCIVGPTATGKSDLGIAVAKSVGGEVVSADSMQVYVGMDVGTAKVTAAEADGVRHHMLDLVTPDVRFTVADWTEGADRAISDILARQRLPIVVGGTGLYVKAITEDLDFAAQEGSNEVRQKWAVYLEAYGAEALHAALAERDRASAERLHPNDTRRVSRALEVYELSRRPMSESYNWSTQGGRYETVQFGLAAPREVLYERVNRRVDAMMERGLLTEVERLAGQGFNLSMTSMQAIGYKELLEYLDGKTDLDGAVALIKQNTRRFVKRQLSWFRRDKRVHWISIDEDGAVQSDDLERIFNTAHQMLAGIQRSGRE